jgi:hypothetical protein
MPVEAIEYLNFIEDTYDITVESNNNFFIKQNNSTLLVHNCLEFVIEQIIGPVTSKIEPEQVIPKVFVHESGVKPKHEYKQWVYAMQFLAKDKDRQKMIVDMAVKDVIAGYYVVIPVVFVKQANELADAIEKRLYKKYDRRGLAIAFTSKVKDRKDVLEKIRKGKIKVTVGIRSLIQAGINVPRWSSIIECSPISNKPNHTQEIARIRTPAPELNKPQPIIHQIVDEKMGGMSTGCFRTCFQVYKDFEWDPSSYAEAVRLLRGLKPSSNYDEYAVKPVRLIQNDKSLFDDSSKSTKDKTVNKEKRGFGFGGLNPKIR